MQLLFERGDRNSPVGHALIYFRADDDAILATYVSVPPIPFDITKFMPPFLAGAMQGVDFNSEVVAPPMPPIPEEVEGIEWLQTLAAQRQDDLVFAGGAVRSNPMGLAAEAAEACREYGELYTATRPATVAGGRREAAVVEPSRFQGLGEGELLSELTRLIGRARDSIGPSGPDPEIMREMEQAASQLPAKYRATELVHAAAIPGERGQRLADLYLQRSYKLLHEEYLDLERLDREIEAANE